MSLPPDVKVRPGGGQLVSGLGFGLPSDGTREPITV